VSNIDPNACGFEWTDFREETHSCMLTEEHEDHACQCGASLFVEPLTPAPRRWSLPAEPGPEVTRLRMYDDEGPMDDTFDRDGTDWREQGSGSPWRWPHLLVSAHYVNARLVDATPTQTPEESAPAGTVDLMAELRSSLERAKAARNGAATTPEESA